MDEITKEFVTETDLDILRDLLMQEDLNGSRYRERIMDSIHEVGIENWFKLKGLPVNPESKWKNRYTAYVTTLNDEVNRYTISQGIEKQGFYLWENYLPIELWNDNDLFEKYKTKKVIQRKLF